MPESREAWDPHVHVQASVVDRARIRAVLTQVLGRSPALPTTVTTGCRQRRPLAMTSVLPERVTCLPCRDAGRRLHLRCAELLELVAELPTTDPPAADEARRGARHHRDIAARFAGPG